MTTGHLGEWNASQVFDIELETSAVAAAIDGRLRAGPLQGRNVNVKWYLKREGLIDMTESPALDYYLILAGRVSTAVSSSGGRRPWCIEAVYLFDAKQLSAVTYAGRAAGAFQSGMNGSTSSVCRPPVIHTKPPRPTRLDQSDRRADQNNPPRAPGEGRPGRVLLLGSRQHQRFRPGTPRYPNWPGW